VARLMSMTRFMGMARFVGMARRMGDARRQVPDVGIVFALGLVVFWGRLLRPVSRRRDGWAGRGAG